MLLYYSRKEKIDRLKIKTTAKFMMPIKTYIIEKNSVVSDKIIEYTKSIDAIEICGVADDFQKAVYDINISSVDLVFINIQIAEMNRVELINMQPLQPLLILTTMHSAYIPYKFELDVLDYLTYPFFAEEFSKVYQKVHGIFKRIDYSINKHKEHINFFFIKSNGRIEKILYDEIIYIEALQNYIMIYTEAKKHLVYMTISRIEEQLPQHLFARVHKSFIIAISKIIFIDKEIINLGSVNIPYSKSNRSRIIDNITKHKIVTRQVWPN